MKSESCFSGCLLIFLPAYCPELNPIEESFSCGECDGLFMALTADYLPVKVWLRRHREQFARSEYPERELLDACFSAVTAEKSRGWFSHSGYL
jgi:hypothetical protein